MTSTRAFDRKMREYDRIMAHQEAERSRPVKIRLTLPLPPTGCSPNSRGHWSKKARAVAEYRARAEMEARRIPASKRHAWAAATTRAAFYLPDRRRRDRDNLAASLKAAWDGLTDAGVLADDHGLQHEPIRVEIDPADPRVEIEVAPLAA